MAEHASVVATVLTKAVQAAQSIVPVPVQHTDPMPMEFPLSQAEMGVLVGITGDLRGSLIIEGSNAVFSAIGQLMFGMALEGPMLESFVGEVGNMVAGNMATMATGAGVTLDITPPTVIIGQTKINGFNKALSLSATLEGLGELQFVLIAEENKN